MSVYEHCAYRNSWECEDGNCDCKNCNYFKLDFDTLTKKQQKAIKRILSHEDDEEVKGGEEYGLYGKYD